MNGTLNYIMKLEKQLKVLKKFFHNSHLKKYQKLFKMLKVTKKKKQFQKCQENIDFNFIFLNIELILILKFYNLTLDLLKSEIKVGKTKIVKYNIQQTKIT